ncbi:MAG: hypothetical protein IJ801_08685 [Lachnospiraceae bacterium]|nr:hypothetical protein [Lachnospiraceae bacterium]
MNLYDEIKSHFILPDAFEDWKDYRNILTDYLIAQTDSISLPLSFCPGMQPSDLLPTLAVLGAGACNDLNLERLCPHFSRITLIDNQTASMETALRTYHLEQSPVIECVTASLNGLEDTDYQDFCEALQYFVRGEQQTLTPERFEAFALSRIGSKPNRQVPLAPASYDYIWCFGVHSQLQAMYSYIYHVFEVNLRHTLFQNTEWNSHVFYDRLKEENRIWIPHFHDALLASANKAVFLGLEQRRLGTEGAIEGAWQGIEDIRHRKLSYTEHTAIWPFCPARSLSYEMRMFHISTLYRFV